MKLIGRDIRAGLVCLIIAGVTAACSSPPSPVLPNANGVNAGSTVAQEFAIWPGVAPGSEGWAQKQGDFSLLGVHAVYNVVRPTLTAYFPDPRKATGTAIIVAPGGGFRFLNFDAEGTKVATWLAEHGIAAFVLKYRTEKMPDGNIGFLIAFKDFAGQLGKFMEKGKSGPPLNGGPAAAGVLVPENPMDWPFTAPADGLQAMKTIRANAEKWHIAMDRIGFMGFSAGSAVTYSVITTAPDADMPNFAATMYYTLSPKVEIPENAPPLFMAANSSDPISRGMPQLYARWIAAGHQAEIHMYPGEEHGFGATHSGKPSDGWMEAYYTWLGKEGFLKQP
jgi:acetyl esterase/lipase